QQLRAITGPLLGPTTLFVALLARIHGYQSVDAVWLMTGGGPDNRTNLLLFYIYDVAFQLFDLGNAATFTVFLLAVRLTTRRLRLRDLGRAARDHHARRVRLCPAGVLGAGGDVQAVPAAVDGGPVCLDLSKLRDHQEPGPAQHSAGHHDPLLRLRLWHVSLA